MTQKTRDRLCDLDEIHTNLHCSIEAVRQSWVAMTQGESEPCKDDYDAPCVQQYLESAARAKANVEDEEAHNRELKAQHHDQQAG